MRLTTMNVNRKNNPENRGAMQVVGTIALAPSGDYMLGDVLSLTRRTGAVRIVRFTCP